MTLQLSRRCAARTGAQGGTPLAHLLRQLIALKVSLPISASIVANFVLAGIPAFCIEWGALPAYRATR